MTSPITIIRRSAARCAHVAGWAAAGVVLTASLAAAADGYLGIYMQEVTASLRRGMDLPRDAGVLVSGVADESPADKAGLREGDVITEVDGHDVGTPDELRDAVRGAGAGHSVSLHVWRDGNERTMSVTLGERSSSDDESGRVRIFRVPDEDDADSGDNSTEKRREIRIYRDKDEKDDGDRVAPRAARGGYLGVGLTELTSQLGDYFGVRSGGVLVTSVEEDSPAHDAGLKAGDVITGIDDEDVESVEDLRSAVREHKPGATVSVHIVRNRAPQTVSAKLGTARRDVSVEGPMGNLYGMLHNMPDGQGFDADRLRGMMRRFQIDTPRGRGARDPHVLVIPSPGTKRGDADLRRELDDLREQLDDLRDQIGKDDESDKSDDD